MDLEDYRREIDRVNAEIVDAVSRRMNVAEEIGAYKKENGTDLRDNSREEEVKQQFEKLFERKNLQKEKGREMAQTLIEMAVEAEKGEIE